MDLDLKPASDYPTPDLVRLLNLSFEGYLIPIHFDNAGFLTMLHKDGIDQTKSRVLLVDDEPSGLALIARRDAASRLAAMGIVKGKRGKKVGSWLMQELIREARQRGDLEMGLEVIEQNEAGMRLYEGCGFQTVRKLIGFSRLDVKHHIESGLSEVDLREMGRLIALYGLPDLPWQLSGETIASLTPPARAYKNDGAYVVLSNPEAEHVVIWSVLVEPGSRGKGAAARMLENVIANHAGKTWHVPAIFPEEMGAVFERAGFQREELSQRQMRLRL